MWSLHSPRKEFSVKVTNVDSLKRIFRFLAIFSTLLLLTSYVSGGPSDSLGAEGRCKLSHDTTDAERTRYDFRSLLPILDGYIDLSLVFERHAYSEAVGDIARNTDIVAESISRAIYRLKSNINKGRVQPYEAGPYLKDVQFFVSHINRSVSEMDLAGVAMNKSEALLQQSCIEIIAIYKNTLSDLERYQFRNGTASLVPPLSRNTTTRSILLGAFKDVTEATLLAAEAISRSSQRSEKYILRVLTRWNAMYQRLSTWKYKWHRASDVAPYFQSIEAVFRELLSEVREMKEIATRMECEVSRLIEATTLEHSQSERDGISQQTESIRVGLERLEVEFIPH